MNRMMKRRIIVVSLLTLALIVGVQGSVLARATQVEVEGVFQGGWKNTSGRGWPDNGGNFHFVRQDFGTTWCVVKPPPAPPASPCVPFQLNSVNDGSVSVTGDLNMILSCTLAPPFGSGPCKGPVTITDEFGTVLWEGRGHLMVVEMISSGQIVAQGAEGTRYVGTQLMLDVQERLVGPPDVFDLTGRLLYPHGE